MIPKRIHYCWFGGNPLPKDALKCIDSWKKYLPDYEIVEWNENNFDINSNPYVKEAYENKKFAFVSDYVRLFAMYNYGGIYMDTDVEVVKPLDEFLKHEAFSGFELPYCISTGIMASEKDFPLFGEFLEYYNDRHFIKEDGSFDMTTNVEIMTGIVEKYGLVKDGSFQVVNGFALYPRDYFCPLDDATGKMYKTANTVTIHWFNKSWIDARQRRISAVTKVFHRIFGQNCFAWLKKLLGRS